jgi:hypothetical protein
MGWVVSAERIVKIRNAYKISIGKRESNKSLGNNSEDEIL